MRATDPHAIADRLVRDHGFAVAREIVDVTLHLRGKLPITNFNSARYERAAQVGTEMSILHAEARWAD